ncbi:MAG: aminotransferase class V-fold PLP-dependent enzyme [bacterium]
MIYLDNAATSRPKPLEVIDAIVNYMTEVCANSGRSGHRLAISASRIVYDTRSAIAKLFNIKDPLRVIFTLNATEGLNLAIKGLLHEHDHVITSSMEHNSVMRPLRAMERRGLEVTVVRCSSTGFLDPDLMRKAIKENTKAIVVNHASNVTGSLAPVEEISEIAKEHGLLFILDAAQTAGSYPIDVQKIHIDMLIFTGHKSLYGPTGVGGLYIKEGIDPEPLKYGGTGSKSEEEYQPNFTPDKYESGTLNIVGIAGLGAGVNFILREGIESIREREIKLTQKLIEGLSSINGVILYGGKEAKTQLGIVSFNIEGYSPSEVGYYLDEKFDIMCRVGLHCAPSAHKTIGTFPEGTVRLSLGLLTTEDDINRTIDAIKIITSKKGFKI